MQEQCVSFSSHGGITASEAINGNGGESGPSIALNVSAERLTDLEYQPC